MFRKKMIVMILAVVMSLGTICTNVLACDGGGWGRYTGNSTYRYEVAGYYYGEDITMERFVFDPDTYVCPDSHMRYMSERELHNFSSLYLLLARNEIYARQGYVFGRPELARYFEGKSWYRPVRYWSENYLNCYEKYNVQLIVAEEERRGGRAKLYWDDWR